MQKNNNYKNILAIDDEETCLEVIVFSLQSYGYSVYTASTAQEGIDFLSKNDVKIDLILLDMMLPDIYGLNALKAIKKIESAKKIPVIVQSGTSNYDDLQTAVNLGAVDQIIRKPYCRKDLLKVIDHVYKKNQILA